MSQSVLSFEQPHVESPRSWQAWGLIKQELVYLCWALMEVSLIAPFALFVMGWARFWNAGQFTLWLLLLILLPFNLVRLLSALQIPRKQQWRILFAALFITMIISWRGLLYAPRPLFDIGWLGEFVGHLGDLGNPLWGRELTVFLFALFAWWRGLRLVQMTPDIYRVGFRLRLGVLLLAPLAFLLHASGHLWGATPFVLLYFLAGLTSVSLIRAEQIEREHSGFAASLTPGWVVTIFVTSLLVILTAGMFAAIISGEVLTVITGRLAPLWTALLATMAVSLATLLFLLTPLFSLMSFLVAQLANFFELLFANAGIDPRPAEITDQGAAQTVSELMTEGESLRLALPPFANQIIAVLIMLGLAVLITFFLTRYLRQPAMAAPSGAAPSGSTTRDKESAGLGERLLQRLGIARRWRTAASIRRIYGDMCHAAAAAGYPRGPAETPYEYLETIYSVWPDNQTGTALITEAYVRVRYGEIPETEDELQAIRSAWQKLSAIRPSTEPASITLE